MDEQTPVLRIVRGDPTDEELAALVGVLVFGTRRRVASAAGGAVTRSAWRRSARPAAGWPVGRRAWRQSGRPR